MKPAAFEMHRPRGLEEALALLARQDVETRVIAGGQSLVPMMNLRLATPAVLIDLNRVEELSGVRRDGDHLRIGAMTRQQDLLESALVHRDAPLLAAAVKHVGHYATRWRGTVGGCLANADPASELVLAAITLRASLALFRSTGRRIVAAEDFFLGTMTTALDADEILTEIIVPVAPEGAKTCFREHARRHGDFAVVAAAAQCLPMEGRLQVGLGAVGPVPLVCRRIEGAFGGGRFSPDLDTLVAAEVAGIEAHSDLRASAAYRRRLVAICLADCVREVCG